MKFVPAVEYFTNLISDLNSKPSKKNIEYVPDPYVEVTYNYAFQNLRYGSLLAAGAVVPAFRTYMANFYPNLRYQRYRTPVRNIMRGTFYVSILAAPLMVYARCRMYKPSLEEMVKECVERRKTPNKIYGDRAVIFGGLLGSLSHRLPGFVWGCALASGVVTVWIKIRPPAPFVYPDEERTAYFRPADSSRELEMAQPPQQQKQWTKHLFTDDFKTQHIDHHSIEDLLRK